MGKGVIKQLEENPTIKKEGGITKEDMKKVVDYVFKNSVSKKEYDNTLYI